MSAKDALRRNKSKLLQVLSADHRLVLTKAQEKELITPREYNKLKNINKEDVEGHVVALVDTIMNKGEKTCRDFLGILESDQDVKGTFPELMTLQLGDNRLLKRPVQASSSCEDMAPESKRKQQENVYKINSQPVGICAIINNENFINGTTRTGTGKDAQSLAEVFSWLGFRVVMCKDKTSEQLRSTLERLAGLQDTDHLQELGLQEWSGSCFSAPLQGFHHGDAFVCCLLSHGEKGAVLGTDLKPLAIKEILRTFKITEESSLLGKPKVFLIQACQGGQIQRGVLLKHVEEDSLLSVPQEADVLVAVATVEDHAAFRNREHGSWFVQSLCLQLKDRCPSGEDITSILHHVNSDVSEREGSSRPGAVKQMPEVRFTLRKRLVLSPHHM